jgi:hypothetical protein
VVTLSAPSAPVEENWEHTPPAHAAPAGQLVPQPPQLLGSVAVRVQVPAQQVRPDWQLTVVRQDPQTFTTQPCVAVQSLGPQQVPVRQVPPQHLRPAPQEASEVQPEQTLAVQV